MPFNTLGRGVAIELITDIDEVLHRSDIDVVHGTEVEDDSLQGWAIVFNVDLLATARTWVIPWAILFIVLAFAKREIVNGNLHQGEDSS